MTRPTGRPKGHPKKYHAEEEKPITISLRVPRELVVPLRRYAAQHRQSMSELLLDGLRWRLSEGAPRGNGLAFPPAGVETDKPYYDNTGEQGRVLREVHAMLASLRETVASGALAAQPPPSRPTGTHDSAAAPVAVEPSEPLPAPVAPASPRKAATVPWKTRILAAAPALQPFTVGTMGAALGHNNHSGQLSTILTALVAKGLLHKEGERAKALYTLVAPDVPAS
jgi:hypothetical protein